MILLKSIRYLKDIQSDLSGYKRSALFLQSAPQHGIQKQHQKRVMNNCSLFIQIAIFIGFMSRQLMCRMQISL
jgi:hypothetical protein